MALSQDNRGSTTSGGTVSTARENAKLTKCRTCCGMHSVAIDGLPGPAPPIGQACLLPYAAPNSFDCHKRLDLVKFVGVTTGLRDMTLHFQTYDATGRKSVHEFNVPRIDACSPV